MFHKYLNESFSNLASLVKDCESIVGLVLEPGGGTHM